MEINEIQKLMKEKETKEVRPNARRKFKEKLIERKKSNRDNKKDHKTEKERSLKGIKIQKGKKQVRSKINEEKDQKEDTILKVYDKGLTKKKNSRGEEKRREDKRREEKRREHYIPGMLRQMRGVYF